MENTYFKESLSFAPHSLAASQSLLVILYKQENMNMTFRKAGILKQENYKHKKIRMCKYNGDELQNYDRMIKHIGDALPGAQQTIHSTLIDPSPIPREDQGFPFGKACKEINV